MSQEEHRGHPIQVGLLALILAGGGWYFFRNYDIDGLDGVTIAPKTASELDFERSEQPFTFASNTRNTNGPGLTQSRFMADPAAAQSGGGGEADPLIFSPSDRLAFAGMSKSGRQKRRPSNLRIASWALDGFGPTKLTSEVSRRNLVRVLRQFDIVSLQQISGVRSDLVPRLVDAVNESSLGGGGPIYDYVVGSPVGPPGHTEQMAILFNPDRVRVDRTQTYTVADPDNQLTFEPLVAWFRAAEPTEATAWTFTIVNVRIELTRAPAEVALLGNLFSVVQKDGRGEDDVVMTGLFQADDAYLMPIVAGPTLQAAVTSTPTDIFGRHQTANVLYDRAATAEATGVGGAYDFLRVYNLAMPEAQAVSSYLPVFAEFSPFEGIATDDAASIQ